MTSVSTHLVLALLSPFSVLPVVEAVEAGDALALLRGAVLSITGICACLEVMREGEMDRPSTASKVVLALFLVVSIYEMGVANKTWPLVGPHPPLKPSGTGPGPCRNRPEPRSFLFPTLRHPRCVCWGPEVHQDHFNAIFSKTVMLAPTRTTSTTATGLEAGPCGFENRMERVLGNQTWSAVSLFQNEEGYTTSIKRFINLPVKPRFSPALLLGPATAHAGAKGRGQDYQSSVAAPGLEGVCPLRFHVPPYMGVHYRSRLSHIPFTYCGQTPTGLQIHR
ncbi:hypothetical protein TREES_T100012317 [Tupaia chinensis]|uniref:Uncharacterized protein n=1 Tax=Tupaia chinensis TaxID=246437 RepID=L9JGB6_TUPCH|nr:hypothetical protein TREES_T100012317 [Tupaia chinensis]